VVPAVNQIERHPRIPNLPLVEYCAKKNIILTAYSAFGNNSWNVPLLVNTPEVKAVADRLGAAQGKTVTAAQVIVAWSVLGNHTVIPKSVTPSRIRENFQEVELDEQAIQDLKKLGETPQRFNIPATCKPHWKPLAMQLKQSLLLTLMIQTNPSGTLTSTVTRRRRIPLHRSLSSKAWRHAANEWTRNIIPKTERLVNI
jgi:hypothetical protein